MQVILSILVSSTLVIGQSLWKTGAKEVFDSTGNKFWVAITNLPLVTGTVLYAIATVLFMVVITKYKYGTSYALIVAFSLIGATAISSYYFDEKISKVGLFGIVLILMGIILVVYKK